LFEGGRLLLKKLLPTWVPKFMVSLLVCLEVDLVLVLGLALALGLGFLDFVCNVSNMSFSGRSRRRAGRFRLEDLSTE